jgi:hypothetical protein
MLKEVYTYTHLYTQADDERQELIRNSLIYRMFESLKPTGILLFALCALYVHTDTLKHFFSRFTIPAWTLSQE